MTISKISANAVLRGKKAPAGWFHSKNKGVIISPNMPDPIRTDFYRKNVFCKDFKGSRGLPIKTAKQIKNVAKAQLHVC